MSRYGSEPNAGRVIPSQGDATLVLVGLGELGGRLLHALAMRKGPGQRIVVVTRDAAKAEPKLNAARFAASYLDLFPRIELAAMDIAEDGRLTDLLSEARPSVVINTASRSPWWARGLLPPPIRERLEGVGAGPGLWAAGHLAITAQIAKAVTEAASDATIVNAAYPDVVNPALAGIYGARLVGVGNLDLLVPAVRHVIAADFGVSPALVTPWLVAHNFHSSRILSRAALGGLRPLLRVEVGGEDVTDRIDVEALWCRIPREMPMPLGAGAAVVAIGSLCRMIGAVTSSSPISTHAPGAAGMAGGYPVRISRDGVALALPGTIDAREAAAVNLAGQRAEGIEEIAPDGTLFLSPLAREVLAEMFRLDQDRITLSDAAAFAGAVLQRFGELARRYGIHLPEFEQPASRLWPV
jgi:malate/lactate dehydrogenase